VPAKRKNFILGGETIEKRLYFGMGGKLVSANKQEIVTLQTVATHENI